uniref:Uncharacterized protein n=1 Tax=viral metagenome TaxID=1070528 RepID=A0A6C0CV92_9ZZZZ
MTKFAKCALHKIKIFLYKKKNEKIFVASYICLVIVVFVFTFFNKNE